MSTLFNYTGNENILIQKKVINLFFESEKDNLFNNIVIYI
jgi:hypothetical protein